MSKLMQITVGKATNLFIKPRCIERAAFALTLSGQKVSERIKELYNSILHSNWADPHTMMQNNCFWENEYQKILKLVQSLKEKSGKLNEVENTNISCGVEALKKLIDLMYRCEDVRDHIAEISEQYSRSHGIAGIDISKKSDIENMNEHIEAIVEEYNKIKKEYQLKESWKQKIEETLGIGIAKLRQTHKFNWSTSHKYNY
ncbi:hypothetical protein cand_000500 [Cryptosporidium andersoni]|uniref:DUF6827 domain-containing protein n=1 Tax=Cryptosporidium andersoni TaxID=117008 RepID=A0A1J4MQJ4_9CRYT|nr:hypothetical protein cand_000500 [Cryptosporidium andersoni]